ncbi:hypothetical protein M426DRAFT_152422 [Hypoxylon sp. CI-4A]|nr:hypothetical protein M426DRAFT_152422 [Hypoxylon sp. CI-4A]
MDPPRRNPPSRDLGPSEQQQWRPDLAHHFLQPGTVSAASDQEFRQGMPLPGQPLPGPHEGLNHLASAAAISDPYGALSGTSPSGARPTSQGGPSAFIASEEMASASSAVNAQHREQLKAKRRVPSSQRKRTQVSCDACKTRRCKCVRLSAAPGVEGEAPRHGDHQAPCKLCVETGITCVTTMPRKQRVYGSVENLDKRYRALEALVSGLFPDLNPRATAEELVSFGRERAITMPEFGESSDQQQQQQRSPNDPLVKPDTTRSPEDSIGRPEQKQGENLVIAGTDDDKTILPPSYLMRFSSKTAQHPSPESATGSAADTNSDDTGLILDASGRPHYIGPCGSLAFFAKMRDVFTQRFEDAGKLGGSKYASRPSMSERGTDVLYVNNPLAASLGGTGDRGRARGSPGGHDAPGAPSHILDHLDGDSPPQICENMLRDHPDDPEFWRYRKRVSLLELPPKDRADAAVQAFFQYVHPNYILFHRLTFQWAYEKMWRCWESHRNRNQGGRAREISVSVGWLCCLYMIFILGSRSLPQSGESLDFQRKWFAQVDQLPPLLGTSSLPNVCAYMLLSLYYHNTNDQTSAWTFHGAACRLAIALGMHRESASGLFEPIERQLRKLVWWTMYSFEQFLCCSLGRPSVIDDREMDVGIPNDDYLDANLLPPRYFEHSARLDMLHAAVRRGIFDPSFVPARMYARALEFLNTVTEWEETLPGSLMATEPLAGLDYSSNQWRSTTLLHIRYHHTLTFLTRPFLFETIQSGNGDQALGSDATKIRALSRVGLTSAMRCGQLVMNLWRADRINGVTWIDIYYAYMCSMDISLALLCPDSLRQDEEHPDIRKPTLIEEYTVEQMREVVKQLCNIMSIIEVCGTNARFAKAAFEFASSLGIIPVEKILSLGLPVPNTKAMAGEHRSSESRQAAAAGVDQQFPGEHRQEPSAAGLDESMAGMQGLQGLQGMQGYYPSAGMNLDFQGNYNYPQSDAMGDVQWDM